MFGRLMVHGGMVWLELKPSPERGDRFYIGAIVVNLTGNGNSSREFSWPEAGLQTAMTMCERNLSTYDAEVVLEEIATGKAPELVLSLIPLMQKGSESAILQRWLELANRQADARRRADYGGMALVFAEAAGCQDVWKAALKGWNVIQSKQVLEWQAEASLATQAEDILKVLMARFGSPDATVSGRVRTVNNIGVLDQLLVAAARCSSLDEFASQLPGHS